MRLRQSNKPPCQLERGEIRRVSQNKSNPLIGYHLCCPKCGFVLIALNGHEDLFISEDEKLEEVTFSKPLECAYCRAMLHVNHSELALEENSHA